MEPLFPDEYESLRESVRALATKKIAPFAHDVDEQARFPQEAAAALIAAGLYAAHVPAEFGGDGADALATVKDRASLIASRRAMRALMLLR